MASSVAIKSTMNHGSLLAAIKTKILRTKATIIDIIVDLKAFSTSTGLKSLLTEQIN